MQNITKYDVIEFTAAVMNASFTTAKTVIPAQGANTAIWVKSVKLTYKAESGTAVVGGNATTLKINGSTICSQDFNGLTASKMYHKGNSLTELTSTHVNQPVTIQTATANPTFYGSVEVLVEYEVLDFA